VATDPCAVIDSSQTLILAVGLSWLDLASKVGELGIAGYEVEAAG